ncbi:arginine N-methyltransferase 2 [Pseudovirgaria hyperparasitica]|uniref:Arginine N-methyltransferase 2 n=1 Tax=Pseudovirgaria hyperparasitica TaxID=470096 RepID=A0A6A6W1P7_9PEZI|nr:arginine N-methyltransferase 2 [Pseudovirgaria hyperparasitica]KAF2755860.1 arginine N-methyltransferase 2 [Pseudovirgaria hyperparasitica]
MSSTGISDEDILLAQRIISAASRHDTEALKILLKSGGSANVRDDTRTTPLHAAIAAGTKENEKKVVDTVGLLLQHGAIWNDTDKRDETPGCIALRLGLQEVYSQMVEAGVRAELLFNALGSIERDMEDVEYDEEDDDVELDNSSYLNSTLRYRKDILLDSSNNAVMMSWETEIMTRHAETLLPKPGLRAMNVGHGMGIVDGQIQLRGPAEHHIIEAHPQVLQRLRETGWYDKPNVTIWEGRWQDMVPKMVEKGVVLDAIYYDTFAEDYAAYKAFVEEGVIPLLDNDGKFGWYNGLGADRQICYDIYTKVAEMDLYEFGFDTTWEDIPVPAGLHGSAEWEGTVRPYWTIDVYRLPINTFIK